MPDGLKASTVERFAHRTMDGGDWLTAPGRAHGHPTDGSESVGGS